MDTVGDTVEPWDIFLTFLYSERNTDFQNIIILSEPYSELCFHLKKR
jgi:hypothetical protein